MVFISCRLQKISIMWYFRNLLIFTKPPPKSNSPSNPTPDRAQLKSYAIGTCENTHGGKSRKIFKSYQSPIPSYQIPHLVNCRKSPRLKIYKIFPSYQSPICDVTKFHNEVTKAHFQVTMSIMRLPGPRSKLPKPIFKLRKPRLR